MLSRNRKALAPSPEYDPRTEKSFSSSHIIYSFLLSSYFSPSKSFYSLFLGTFLQIVFPRLRGKMNNSPLLSSRLTLGNGRGPSSTAEELSRPLGLYLSPVPFHFCNRPSVWGLTPAFMNCMFPFLCVYVVADLYCSIWACHDTFERVVIFYAFLMY